MGSPLCCVGRSPHCDRWYNNIYLRSDWPVIFLFIEMCVYMCTESSLLDCRVRQLISCALQGSIHDTLPLPLILPVILSS